MITKQLNESLTIADIDDLQGICLRPQSAEISCCGLRVAARNLVLSFDSY